MKSTESSDTHILPWVRGSANFSFFGEVIRFSWAILFVSFLIFAPSIVLAQNTTQPTIGIDEALGQKVPLDLTFADENGNPVTLGELIDKPTIVTLVYYRCPGICPLILSGTVEVVSKLQLTPGQDYKVLTISFDETDTPEASRQKKTNYLHSLQGSFPEDAWRFVTADLQNIKAFTDAVGYRFRRQGVDFAHPSALIVLGSDGTISRYLYGTDYLPFDVKMALIEASEGRVGASINRVLKFCFSYDPEGRTYAFNVTRVAGSIVILLALVFLMVLLIKGKSQKEKES